MAASYSQLSGTGNLCLMQHKPLVQPYLQRHKVTRIVSQPLPSLTFRIVSTLQYSGTAASHESEVYSSTACSSLSCAVLLPVTAGWWFKPDFIINELNINSAVSRPWHDEVLPLGTNNTYTMNGYAYTGGQHI